MFRLVRRLWSDEAGFIVSAELILVATIAVLASIVGLSAVSTAVNGELIDVANGFDALNQDARYTSLNRTGAAGSSDQAILGSAGATAEN